MKETDVAWAAGFWEGEGHLMIVFKSNGDFQCHCGAGQKLRDPLDRLHDLFGGYIRRERMGVNNAWCFTWDLFGKDSVPFLKEIVPYVATEQRRREIEIYLRFFLSEPNSLERAKLFVLWKRRRKRC